MLEKEVFVGEGPAVDGLAASAVVVGEISPLGHEVGDDAMEAWPFEPEAFFVSAESSEVGCGFGGFLVEELEDEFSGFVAAEIYFEEDVFEGHGILINQY